MTSSMAPTSEADESLLGAVSSSLGDCRVLSLMRVAATVAFALADWAAEAGALRGPTATCLAVTLAIGAFRAVDAPTRRLAIGLFSASAAAARVTRVRSATSHLSSPISVFMNVLPAVTAFMSGSSECSTVAEGTERGGERVRMMGRGGKVDFLEKKLRFLRCTCGAAAGCRPRGMVVGVVACADAVCCGLLNSKLIVRNEKRDSRYDAI